MPRSENHPLRISGFNVDETAPCADLLLMVRIDESLLHRSIHWCLSCTSNLVTPISSRLDDGKAGTFGAGGPSAGGTGGAGFLAIGGDCGCGGPCGLSVPYGEGTAEGAA